MPKYMSKKQKASERLREGEERGKGEEGVGEGEGKIKKISKKNAAIAVLEELKKLPPLPTVERVKPRIKKKTKSIVRVRTCLKEEGVKAVTYMPTRNTPAQLERLRGLCDQYGMFQISGEDINTPRQSFIIKAMENPMFQNLIDATWKLIAHENR